MDSVLLEWQGYHRSALAAGLEILEHSGPQRAALLSVDSIGKLVGTLIFLATVEPPTGVLTSLITSGQLGLIQNPELRTALASWQAVLADTQEDEDQVTRQVETRMYPYLDSRVAFRSVAALQDWYPREPSPFPEGFAEILRDRQFETLVESRIFFTHWTLAAYDEALENVALIRSLIGDELARGP